MKHFLLLFTLVMLAISANCQLDKKYWLFGGSGSFFSYNDDFTTTGQPTVSGKLTEINLSANVGYFIFDKFAAGLRPGVNSIKSRSLNSAGAGTKNIIVFLGPFARYYFFDKEKLFNIVLDGTYQIGSQTNFEGRGVFRKASVMAGPELFLNSSVGIEFLIGYLYQKQSIDKTQSGYYYQNIKNGFNVSIGFQIHLTNN